MVERILAPPACAPLTCFTVSTGTMPTIAAPVICASSTTRRMVSGSMKRPHGVMYRDIVRIGVERAQGILHRLLPGIAARDHAQAAQQALALVSKQIFHPFDIVFANRHHHVMN